MSTPNISPFAPEGADVNVHRTRSVDDIVEEIGSIMDTQADATTNMLNQQIEKYVQRIKNYDKMLAQKVWTSVPDKLAIQKYKEQLNALIGKLKQGKISIIQQYKNFKNEYLKVLITMRTSFIDEVFDDLDFPALKKINQEIARAQSNIAILTNTMKKLGIIDEDLEKQIFDLAKIPQNKGARVALEKKVAENKAEMSEAQASILSGTKDLELLGKNLSLLKKQYGGLEASTIKKNTIDAMTKIKNNINTTYNDVLDVYADFWVERDFYNNGIKTMYEKMLVDEDVTSIWFKATKRTGKDSIEELNQMNKELMELSELAKSEERSEFLRVAAEYSAPSQRLIIAASNELAEFRREGQGLKEFIMDTSDMLFKGVIDSAEIIASIVVEKVLGPAALTALIKLAEIMTRVTDSLIYLVGGIGELAVMGIAAYNIIKDGFTFKALDDTFQTVTGLSLKILEDPGARLKADYTDTTQLKKPDNAQTKILLSDSQEFQIKFDYWGDAFMKELKAINPHYKDYVRMKEPKVFNRIPGRYIKNDHHPGDSDKELRDSANMERQLTVLEEADPGEFTGYIGNGSQIFKHYPKKKGYTRNLVNFPFFQKSFKWPDPNGSQFQTQGMFQKSDIDPTIAETFETFVKTGKYGPLYNKAKSKEGQDACIAANNLDFKAYMEPFLSYKTAKTTFHTWMKNLSKGGQKAYYNDLIITSPETFSWNKPPNANPSFKEIYTKSGLPDTLDYFQYNHDKIGAWTFETDRLFFYKEVMAGRMWITDREWTPDPLFPERLSRVQRDKGVNGKSATDKEIKYFTGIYNKGLKQKKYYDGLSYDTNIMWNSGNDMFMKLWEDYRKDIGVYEPDVNKKSRSYWTYIDDNRTLFLKELQDYTGKLQRLRKERLSKELLSVEKGGKSALNIDAANRSLFMAKLNKVSFEDKPEITAEDLIAKNFGSLVDNIVLSGQFERPAWAKNATRFQVILEGENTDVRIFTTQDPNHIIIVFSDSNVFDKDPMIDLKNSESVFIQVKDTETTDPDNRLHFPKVKIYGKGANGGFPKDPSFLMKDPNVFQVFTNIYNGFSLFRDMFIDTVTELIVNDLNTIRDMHVTGYGKGAQMAQLSTLYLPRVPIWTYKVDTRFKKSRDLIQIKDPNCYTFGSPPVGDKRFSVGFSSLTDESVSVWIDGDVAISVPPVILPDKEFKELYDKEIETLKIAVAKFPMFSGELYLLSQEVGFKPGNLNSYLNLLDDPTSKHLYDTFTFEKMNKDIGDIVKANVNFQAYRGQGIFLRLNENGSAAFETNRKDPLNSPHSLSHLMDNKESRDHLKRLHDMDSIIGELEEEISKHAKDFKLDKDQLANWDKEGEINGPKSKPKPKPNYPSNKIIDDLIKGGASVIGYAHTKHHHRTGTIVSKDDIDMYTSLPIPYHLQSITDERTSAKRRKIVKKKEGDYHGNYY